MAIAFVSAEDASGSSVSSLTWAHTISGTQRVLIVGVQVDSAGVLGVTFNGAAMTRVSNTGTPGGNMDLYYLFTPPVGTYNVVASLNTTCNPRAASALYTGAAGPSPDASNSNGGTGTSLVTSVTTTTDNCWIMGVGYSQSADGPTAGGDTTQRTATAHMALFDSNLAITPAGATDLAIGAGTSTPLRLAVVAIKPATVSPTTTTSSTTSTSTSTSSSTSSSSSTSTSSTTTPEPPPDVQETGVPIVYVRQ